MTSSLGKNPVAGGLKLSASDAGDVRAMKEPHCRGSPAACGDPAMTTPSSHSSCPSSGRKSSTAGSRFTGLTSSSSILPTPLIGAFMLATRTTTGSSRLMSAARSGTMPSLMFRALRIVSFSAPMSTKQPKPFTPVTMPPSSWPTSSSDSCRPRCSGISTFIAGIMESSSWPFRSSLLRMRAVTLSPTLMTSRASFTNFVSRICVLCRRALLSAPTSTKAPKGSTFCTVPVTCCPTMKSDTTLRPRFFMVSPRNLASDFSTRTLTLSPTLANVDGSLM
mmetsp:Transcript_6136/g.15737  ORF Transcript_6136/g.15737 Transcript_6136/m.15737 type:complete len:278 (-) Transcript_6136:147-980(-)